MNVTDEAIRYQVWKGVIPVVVNLVSHEISTLLPPKPFYLTVPRMSYLPLVTQMVRDHFSAAAPAIIDEMWFEYNGTPLKWHVPIGVLYDSLVPLGALPWALTVHFRGFPSETILRCPGEGAVRRVFFHALKESQAVTHGNAGKVNALSVAAAEELWGALKTFSWDAWERAVEPLRGNERGWGVRVVGGVTPLWEASVPSDKPIEWLGSQLPGGPWRMVVQGCEPPPGTPLGWLGSHCAHPDGFLYVSLHSLST